MSRVINHAETAVDCTAAAVLSAAVAFACVSLHAEALAVVVAPLAFGAAFAGLRRIDAGGVNYPQMRFAPAALDLPSGPSAEIHSSSDVVRLFNPRQLAIARASGLDAAGEPADASQALSDALAQVRRALR